MTLNLLQKTLHQKAQETARRFRRDEIDLIDILQKIEDKKVFRALGYTSLFQYAVQEANLSEANAYSFIKVSRKAREVPQLKNEIKQGNITVSKAKKISPVIQKENASLWLEKAKSYSKHQLEKEIAKVAPREATPEKAKYVSETRIDLRLGVEEKLMQSLRRIQDLLSQKNRRHASLEDVLEELSKDYISRHDPVIKAKRILQRRNTSQNQCLNEKLGPGPVELAKKEANKNRGH